MRKSGEKVNKRVRHNFSYQRNLRDPKVSKRHRILCKYFQQFLVYLLEEILKRQHKMPKQNIIQFRTEEWDNIHIFISSNADDQLLESVVYKFQLFFRSKLLYIARVLIIIGTLIFLDTDDDNNN